MATLPRAEQFPRGEREQMMVGCQRDLEPVQGRTEVGKRMVRRSTTIWFA
jgi:hypothetical protein